MVFFCNLQAPYFYVNTNIDFFYSLYVVFSCSVFFSKHDFSFDSGTIFSLYKHIVKPNTYHFNT